MVRAKLPEDTPMPERANQRISYFNGRDVPEAAYSELVGCDMAGQHLARLG